MNIYYVGEFLRGVKEHIEYELKIDNFDYLFRTKNISTEYNTLKKEEYQKLSELLENIALTEDFNVSNKEAKLFESINFYLKKEMDTNIDNSTA